LRVAVLVSGNGTNLQALLDAGPPVEVVLVGCNRADAAAMGRAKAAGVPVCLADRLQMPRRMERQSAILDAVRQERAELIVLAGFDEILMPEFVAEFSGRLINTHPSLLPAFGGTLHAVEQALEHGVKVTGCTVHLVTDDLDNGPILLQCCVDVREGDDAASLHARILEQEHRLLCEAVRAFAEGRVRVQGHKAHVIASN
jgi:phosphoribosylglycinamide formyltransferase 1